MINLAGAPSMRSTRLGCDRSGIRRPLIGISLDGEARTLYRDHPPAYARVRSFDSYRHHVLSNFCFVPSALGPFILEAHA